MDQNKYTRNVVLDLVLTVMCCGLWNLVVQNSHINALNAHLKEERYAFWKVCLFSLLTCGLYGIYFEYCKAKEIAALTKAEESSEVILAIVLSIIGLHWVYDAIFQDKLNQYFRKIDAGTLPL